MTDALIATNRPRLATGFRASIRRFLSASAAIFESAWRIGKKRKPDGRQFDRRLWLNTERMTLIAERQRAKRQHKATSGYDQALRRITTELLRGE